MDFFRLEKPRKANIVIYGQLISFYLGHHRILNYAPGTKVHQQKPLAFLRLRINELHQILGLFVIILGTVCLLDKLHDLLRFFEYCPVESRFVQF